MSARRLLLVGAMVLLAGCTSPTLPEALAEQPRCSDGEHSVEVVELQYEPATDQFTIGFRNLVDGNVVIDFVEVWYRGVGTISYGPIVLHSAVGPTNHSWRITFGSPETGTLTSVALRPGRGGLATFGTVAPRPGFDYDPAFGLAVTRVRFLGVPPGGQARNIDGPDSQPIATCLRA